MEVVRSSFLVAAGRGDQEAMVLFNLEINQSYQTLYRNLDATLGIIFHALML
jgi:hypothetical protein